MTGVKKIDRNLVKTLYDEGLTCRAIADKIGCDPSVISRICRREFGLKPHSRARIDRSLVKALHAQGLTDKSISEKLGCYYVTIQYIRKELGLPCNYASRRHWLINHPRCSYDIRKEPFAISPLILKIRSLRLYGHTWREVAKLTGQSVIWCTMILRDAYKPVYEGEGCIRWEDAVKGLTPRTINLLDKYGGCLSK